MIHWTEFFTAPLFGQVLACGNWPDKLVLLKLGIVSIDAGREPSQEMY